MIVKFGVTPTFRLPQPSFGLPAAPKVLAVPKISPISTPILSKSVTGKTMVTGTTSTPPPAPKKHGSGLTAGSSPGSNAGIGGAGTVGGSAIPGSSGVGGSTAGSGATPPPSSSSANPPTSSSSTGSIFSYNQGDTGVSSSGGFNIGTDKGASDVSTTLQAAVPVVAGSVNGQIIPGAQLPILSQASSLGQQAYNAAIQSGLTPQQAGMAQSVAQNQVLAATQTGDVNTAVSNGINGASAVINAASTAAASGATAAQIQAAIQAAVAPLNAALAANNSGNSSGGGGGGGGDDSGDSSSSSQTCQYGTDANGNCLPAPDTNETGPDASTTQTCQYGTDANGNCLPAPAALPPSPAMMTVPPPAPMISSTTLWILGGVAAAAVIWKVSQSKKKAA